MPIAPHRERFRVRAYEAGPTGHASVLTLCDYFQEAAGNHAAALGVERPELAAGVEGAWVLRRLRLVVERLPTWGEAIVVETWPSAQDGLRAFRDFRILGEAGAPYATGDSTWFVIDPERRRPARLPEGVTGLRLPDRPRVLEDTPPPPKRLDADAAADFTVRRSDLDLNAHANHVCFVEWALEALPDAFQARSLSHLDLVIDAEALAGDHVDVAHLEAEPDEWLHHVRRDGRTLARLATRWVSA